MKKTMFIRYMATFFISLALLILGGILVTNVMVYKFEKGAESNLGEINQKMIFIVGAVFVGVLTTVLFALLLKKSYFSEEKRNKLMEKAALYHPLTGLPNWQYLVQNFEQIIENKTMVYLLMCIPDFRRISGVFGYPVAARMLKDIADVFRSSMEDGDIAVHVSEDYFALLLKSGKNKENVERKINNIFQKLEEIPMKESNVIYDYHCSFSGGAYFIGGADEELNIISRRANAVLDFQPKEKGVFWGWYEASMSEKISLQESLMPELLRALENEEFVPFFQPQYNISTGEVIGAEVLARWNNPTHGILLPGVFVPLLEGKGCIFELDLIMLEKACKMISEWLAKGIFPVPMTINISRLNIHRKDFIDKVIAVVEKYEIPESLIILELDEAAITENSEKLSVLVKELKSKGFLLSMDDYSHGYSSLNMLREIPLNIIKLSRTFLKEFKEGERSKVILCHVVEMLKELNARVVAEGIETKEQEIMVQEIGCEYAQGFFYNRPMSADDFEELMLQ